MSADNSRSGSAGDLASRMIYLDNGATSFPKPPEVYEFMDRFYRRYGVNPGRSGYDLCIDGRAVLFRLTNAAGSSSATTPRTC